MRCVNRALPLALAALSATVVLSGCGGGGTGSGEASSKSTTSTETKSEQTKSAEPESVAPQPFNVSGLLAGDAKPELPAGEAGKVAVVAQAPLEKDMLDAATLPFVFRNNTDEAISHVDWTATATAGGKLVATGSSQGTQPAQIAPGEVGMAFIYFEAGKSIPDTGATYEFTAETTEADTSSYNTAPLAVGEANRNGKKIVGSATNKTGKPVTGPYGAEVYCFDGNNLTGRTGSFAEEDGDIQPDGTVHFTVDLFDSACKTFAVGVSGYFS